MQLPLPMMAVASAVTKSIPQKVGTWVVTPIHKFMQLFLQVDTWAITLINANAVIISVNLAM